MQSAKEPAYPVEAFADGPAGEAAEQGFWDKVLVDYGRTNEGKVDRLCRYFADMGVKLGFACPAPRVAEPPPKR